MAADSITKAAATFERGSCWQFPVPDLPQHVSAESGRHCLVPKLSGDVPLLVHFAIGALMDYSRCASARPQNSVRHHPRFDQVRVVDSHLVKNLIALPRQLLNHMHVGGMEQAAA